MCIRDRDGVIQAQPQVRVVEESLPGVRGDDHGEGGWCHRIGTLVGRTVIADGGGELGDLGSTDVIRIGRRVRPPDMIFADRHGVEASPATKTADGEHA